MRTKRGTLALDEAPKKLLGSIKRRKNSQKLYVDFYYFGHRVTRSTELNDSPANERKVRSFLDKVMQKIADGTFKFAEAFPGSSEEEKAFFTQLEGREYQPEPHQVLFGEYAKEWLATIYPSFGSPSKRRDYMEAITRRILPAFKNMTFHQITGMAVFKFTGSMTWKKGIHKGKPLSTSRKSNILIPFRGIWNDACDHYRWTIKSPFDNLRKRLPKTEKKEHTVLRFADWLTFLDNLEEHYRPIAELMILTGMIPSELASITRENLVGDYLKLTGSYVLGEEKTTLKTAFRKREIYITAAIRKLLDVLQARATTPFLFTTDKGKRLNSVDLAKNWKRAVEQTSIPAMTSYSARHSFAAWSLIIGINPLRLVKLMGHASKQMVYEVYGNYVEGLEEDAEAIYRYFGEDFIAPRKNKSPVPFSNSTGDSFQRFAVNT